MELAQIETKLAAMERELLERQARLAKHTEHREDPLSAKFSEQANELANEETIEQLAERVAAELAEVHLAKGRLRDGRYGFCDQCAGPIEPARLKALPTTRRCVGCA